ncbi:MAG: glutamine-hydrolyzing GMP synthase [Candidatus Bipolaricaulota bacterium]|nr:glutamine-hydrolyzing GMP synthase [Candidatus Bipolaricaulota bacterium]
MESLLIVDFGSQYTKLIAKLARELGVYAEIVSSEIGAEELERRAPKGLILSGGPASVYAPEAPRLDPAIYRLKIPILGICYGMQLLAHEFGGRVLRGAKREYGSSVLEILQENTLLKGLGEREEVWMSHGDEIQELPKEFVSLAKTANVAHAAMKSRDGLLYGIQFHPEVAHTPKGREILKNFLFGICHFEGRWRPTDRVSEIISDLRKQLEHARHVLIGVSGGVDSSTAAVLVHRAIGERLISLFVDTGLLRLGEVERTQKVFERLGIELKIVDAKARFLKALQGVTDPEEKRKRIGTEFIRVFEEEAQRLERTVGPIDVLVQGTIYSDVIESGAPNTGARRADRIKSHHNVGGLPERFNFKIVEPLRNFFKDEVRQIGLELGIPAEIIWEQPFPGPGLAVRILGEVTAERVALLQRVDAILREEISHAGLSRALWQYFAVLLPVRAVAVLGDGRAYGHVVALRAVESRDGMTADWVHLPYDVLERISNRITNEVEGVTRVVYDITSKPPATIEWE